MINMIKKYNLIVIGIILIISAIPVTKADSSFQIKIDDVLNKKNITITHPVTKDKYLLYLGIGCSEMTKWQDVSLIIKGALNGGDDILKEDSVHQCNIERADLFTNKIYVDSVLNENTKAFVVDENETRYYMSFGSSCSAIAGYKQKYIYVFQAGKSLSKSDRIIIPDKGGQCSIYYLENLDLKKSKDTINNLDKVPTTVTDVKPFPRNGSVFLAWRPAKDDNGISYYIISYNHSSLYTKDVLPENMPNRIQVKSTHYTVPNLENDRPYYFYVIAVNTAGNVSSDWSEGAYTVPKASIMPDSSSSGVKTVINIRLATQNSSSLLIRWTPISGSKQTVKFEVDGKIEFVQYQYGKSYISISKKADYKGKSLTLTIKATDIRGTAKEEKINFEF